MTADFLFFCSFWMERSAKKRCRSTSEIVSCVACHAKINYLAARWFNPTEQIFCDSCRRLFQRCTVCHGHTFWRGECLACERKCLCTQCGITTVLDDVVLVDSKLTCFRCHENRNWHTVAELDFTWTFPAYRPDGMEYTLLQNSFWERDLLTFLRQQEP